MKHIYFLFTLLLTFIAQAQVHHIDSQGREWKRLDTTKNISLSYLQQNCLPTCLATSTLNGYTWANQQQVTELMQDFSPVIPTVDAIDGFFAAGEFMAKMGYTYGIFSTYQTYQEAIGVTSSVDEAGAPLYGVASYSHSGTGTTAGGGLSISLVSASHTTPKGAFLIKTSEVPPVTCSHNGQTYSVGQTVSSYLSSSVPYGSSCQTVSRTCLSSGQFDGVIVSQCTVQPGASCSYNGQVINHGSTVSGYLPSTSSKSSCVAVTRTCINGVLSGPITPTCANPPRVVCKIRKGVQICETKR